jgi:ATP-binding cassette subfamily F protein 3
MTKGNLLLLDEPTNHIDALTRAALEDALIAYTGAVLLVSHDRYFMDRVVNRVGVLTSDALRLWEGDYSAYRRFRQAAAQTIEPEGRKEWERERRRRRQAVRDERRLTELERAIAERESSLAEAEREAAAAGGDYARAAEWYARAEALRAELDALLTQWIEV